MILEAQKNSFSKQQGLKKEFTLYRWPSQKGSVCVALVFVCTINQVTSASLRYPLSVFNKNSTLKRFYFFVCV